MKMEFTPKINKAAFGERVTQEREGNWYAGITKKFLEGNPEKSIYDKFIALCADKNITITSCQEDTATGRQYSVALWVNGYESHSMTYSDPGRDITEMLASELYGLLIARFNNQQFFEEHLPDKVGQIYPEK